MCAVACNSGGSNDSSTTPTVLPGTSEPADTIAIFGNPEMSRAVLEAALDATGPGMFLMGSVSIGDGQFEPNVVPSAPSRGAKLVATPRDPEFAGRFSSAYPDTAEQPGVREAYDSVYLVALAALAANSSDPAAIRDHIVYVANSPGEPVNASPEGLTRSVELLGAGGDIDLIGASGLLDFATDEAGQSAVSKAAAEVWTIINGAYTPLETRDVDLVAEIGAENPAGTLARGEGITAPIKIGAIASTTAVISATVRRPGA